MPALRPLVENLVFQLYSRPLHPELFETAAREHVRRCDFEAQVRITPTGHAITWIDAGRRFLTEVLTTWPEEGCPPQGSVFSHHLGCEHYAQANPWPGIRYQASFQVEVLPLYQFLIVHDELIADGQRRGLLHRFPARIRSRPEPIGFITMDGRPGVQLIHAFHTFPEECKVVKSQSLIEHAPV